MSPLPQRLGLLLALYLAQGIPFGVYSQAIPAILRSHDAPLSLISLSGLLALPWALKVLWAPWVDRYWWPGLGYRRSWLLPMNLGMIAVLAALMAFDPASLHERDGVLLLFALLFLANLLSATQDIASDGLSVSLLRPAERGLGNGVQVAAHRLGTITGGGALLYVMGTSGWDVAFAGLMALSALLLIPVLLLREPPPPERVSAGPGESPVRVWLGFFQRPGLQGWIWVLATHKMADSLASAMVKPMLIDMGFSLASMGVRISLAGAVATIAGALLGGWLVAPLGRRRALVLFSLAQALACGAFMLPAAGQGLAGLSPLALAVLINAVEHLFGGLASAAMLAAVMDRCRLAHGGSDFTLQVSVLAAFGGLLYLPAGLFAEQLGYADFFLVAGVAGLLLLWPAWRYTREPDALRD
ncbi:MAG: MFS transporter [Perlucidibaca sp.]